MAYQLYRNTTLGNSLQESLDELIQSQQITPQLALQVLLQFDKAINSALAQRVRNRVNFRGSLNTYRFCDNVWTFVLNDVEFREVTELIKVDKVKIVACDGKNTGSYRMNRKKWLFYHLSYYSPLFEEKHRRDFLFILAMQK
uniref:Transcription initiation factor IIA subunit 2 n=1 Tax=Loxodonta africana TaxID=9785 RepID=G3T681_LOXAF